MDGPWGGDAVATEVILEVTGLPGTEVRDYLRTLGGTPRTPRRMRGRGWTAVIQEDATGFWPWESDRVLLHVLGTPGAVSAVVRRLQNLGAH